MVIDSKENKIEANLTSNKKPLQLINMPEIKAINLIRNIKSVNKVIQITRIKLKIPIFQQHNNPLAHPQPNTFIIKTLTYNIRWFKFYLLWKRIIKLTRLIRT